MVDVRELHKRGIVNLNQGDSVIPTNNEGYVELSEKGFKSLEPKSKKVGFSFYGNSSSSSNSMASSSDEEESYTKREIDARLERLDSALYRLEQRLEVIERKLGVNSGESFSSSSSSDDAGAFGAMGW